MENIELTLVLKATKCNTRPVLELFNTDSFHIELSNNHEIDMPLDNSGVLKIGMVGKKFGEENIWDTQTDDAGNIVADKTIEFISAEINGVDILDLLINSEYSTGSTYNKILNFNGHLTFNYYSPIYKCLTNLKFKQTNTESKSYFSDHGALFNYENQLKLISEINELINET